MAIAAVRPLPLSGIPVPQNLGPTFQSPSSVWNLQDDGEMAIAASAFPSEWSARSIGHLSTVKPLVSRSTFYHELESGIWNFNSPALTPSSGSYAHYR